MNASDEKWFDNQSNVVDWEKPRNKRNNDFYDMSIEELSERYLEALDTIDFYKGMSKGMLNIVRDELVNASKYAIAVKIAMRRKHGKSHGKLIDEIDKLRNLLSEFGDKETMKQLNGKISSLENELKQVRQKS